MNMRSLKTILVGLAVVVAAAISGVASSQGLPDAAVATERQTRGIEFLEELPEAVQRRRDAQEQVARQAGVKLTFSDLSYPRMSTTSLEIGRAHV